MSNINYKWLTENLKDGDIIFDIGCADIGGDTRTFRQLFPNSAIYAFECSRYWKEHNEQLAKEFDINYYHVAVSDHTNGVSFYQSDTNNEEQWPWSGSTYKPNDYLNNIGLKFTEPYTVPSITLNQFCGEHDVTPDFIHIDAQGAEYSIFKDLMIRPKVIWAEISEFHLYDTKVTYHEFNRMMLGYGYEQKYLDNHDSLYVRNDVETTLYTTG